jgi:hypothetical protein
MRKLLFAAAASVMAIGSPAYAAEQIYDTALTTGSTQNWGGTLGLNFQVNAPILVSALGAFDNGLNGITNDLYVGIFDSLGNVIVSFTNFNGTAADPTNHYVFQNIAPVILQAGSYQLASFGYNLEGNFNNHAPNPSPITFNTMGGRLTALGTSYSAENQPGVFATIADNGLTRYGAGSFLASAVPEPAIWAMMIGGFALIGGLARRRSSRTPVVA